MSENPSSRVSVASSGFRTEIRSFFLVLPPAGPDYPHADIESIKSSLDSAAKKSEGLVYTIGDGKSPISQEDIEQGFAEFVQRSSGHCCVLFIGHGNEDASGKLQLHFSDDTRVDNNQFLSLFATQSTPHALSIFYLTCHAYLAVQDVACLPSGAAIIGISGDSIHSRSLRSWSVNLANRESISPEFMLYAYLVPLAECCPPCITVSGGETLHLDNLFNVTRGETFPKHVLDHFPFPDQTSLVECHEKGDRQLAVVNMRGTRRPFQRQNGAGLAMSLLAYLEDTDFSSHMKTLLKNFGRRWSEKRWNTTSVIDLARGP